LQLSVDKLQLRALDLFNPRRRSTNTHIYRLTQSNAWSRTERISGLASNIM